MSTTEEAGSPNPAATEGSGKPKMKMIGLGKGLCRAKKGGDGPAAVNKPPSFGATVLRYKAARNAARSFKSLVKPQRPPMPGTATPAGYVINRKPAPPDATALERFRGTLLDLGTRPFVAYIQVVWLLILIPNVVVFLGCMLYWFNWGYLEDPTFPCTTNSTQHLCIDGYYQVLSEDYWQEKMTQVMSALFTYSTLLAAPWRAAILHQIFSQRCRGKEGVDFFGRPNEMPFFHISRSERRTIAILLNLAVVCQIVHQILHLIWNDCIVYFESPEGQISLMTGPVAGCITGVGAGLIQFRAEDRLHTSAPDRFPPGLLAFAGEIIRRLRKGESLDDLFSDIKAEDALKDKQAQAAHDVAPQSTAACATPEVSASCV